MAGTIGDDALERIARSIHESYVASRKADGKTTAGNPSIVPWDELSADLKRANLGQAAQIVPQLDAIGAAIIPAAEAKPEQEFVFSGEEVEFLARREHDRWTRERTASGWTYGTRRDNDHKLHPDLVPWPNLTEASRDKDREAVRAILEAVRAAGYEIRRKGRTR